MERFFDKKRLVRWGFALLLAVMGLLIGTGFAKSARQASFAGSASLITAIPLSC